MAITNIYTISSRKFDIENLQPESISIHDIAHALAYNCRFGGHIQPFYTVAQHSVLTAWNLIPNRDASIEDLMMALLHDATEAYICDIPAPFKALLPDYIALEAKLHAYISQHFQLPPQLTPCVKQADRRMLATEVKYIRNAELELWCGIEKPYDSKIKTWSPKKSKRIFLYTFEILQALREDRKPKLPWYCKLWAKSLTKKILQYRSI